MTFVLGATVTPSDVFRYAIATLALVACAQPTDTDVGSDYAPDVVEPGAPIERWRFYLDPHMPPREAEAVAGAAQAWQRALVASCPIDIALSVGGGDLGADLRAVRVVVGEPGPGRMGSAFERVVTIRAGLNDRDLRVTTRHELGHAIGLDHQPTGIMREATESNGIERSDAEAFDALRCR